MELNAVKKLGMMGSYPTGDMLNEAGAGHASSPADLRSNGTDPCP
jgi:hypothetical protein